MIEGSAWETIQEYDWCPEINVKKGDKIVVESTYHLTKYRLHPGAMDHYMGGEGMALIGFNFATKE